LTKETTSHNEIYAASVRHGGVILFNEGRRAALAAGSQLKLASTMNACGGHIALSFAARKNEMASS
jgi:hypothetical protein